MAQAKAQIVNGIDIRALNEVIEAVKKTPAIARATFAVESATERGFNARSRTLRPSLGGPPCR